ELLDQPGAKAHVPEMAAKTVHAGLWNCPTLATGGGGFRDRGLVKALQDSGAGLLSGTDFPLTRSIAEELEILVAYKLTPYQALATSTRNVAAFFGTLETTGTIGVGKRADLVLLDGNPLESIKNIENPIGVMLGGQWLSREDFARRLAA